MLAYTEKYQIIVIDNSYQTVVDCCFKANVKQKIDMEIVITTIIIFIKKVTKSNTGENNLIENNKNNRRNNDK